MPSPVGHFLGGVAVGWLVAPPATVPGSSDALRQITGKLSRNTLVLGCAAVLPDLDILFGSHRTATHSLTAVVLVFLATLALRGPGHVVFATAVAGAFASHSLLDWLSHDPTSPTGIMLLWPVSRQYLPAPAPVFMAIMKDVWRPATYAHNAVAVIREVLILLPVVALIGWLRRPKEVIASTGWRARAMNGLPTKAVRK